MGPVVGWWSPIDLAVLAAIGLVLPVALGHRRWWWLATAAVAASFIAQTGSPMAVALASVWPLAALVVAVLVVADRGPLRTWRPSSVVPVVEAGYALAAASWLVISRAGLMPLGIPEPIVELTAVHFTYVGVGALALADAARRNAAVGDWRAAGAVATTLVVAAPPVVAAGFTTRLAVAQIGGAVLLSAGVLTTATLQLREAAIGRPVDGSTPRRRTSRWLLGVSGLAPWIPMVLAVAWAAGQHLDVPALSIPDLVRTHGLVNAVGFVGAGLVARALSHDLDRPASVATNAKVGTWS